MYLYFLLDYHLDYMDTVIEKWHLTLCYVNIFCFLLRLLHTGLGICFVNEH